MSRILFKKHSFTTKQTTTKSIQRTVATTTSTPTYLNNRTNQYPDRNFNQRNNTYNKRNISYAEEIKRGEDRFHNRNSDDVCTLFRTMLSRLIAVIKGTPATITEIQTSEMITQRVRPDNHF